MITAKCSRKGFTILETLLAIAILMIGSIGVLGLFTVAAQSHDNAVEETQAALAAESLFSYARTLCTREHLGDMPFTEIDQPVEDHQQFYYDLQITSLDITGDPADDKAEMLVTLTLKSGPGDDPNLIAYRFQTVFLLDPF